VAAYTAIIKSADALLLLYRNGNFVQSSGWNDANQPDWQYMRETAYALNVQLNSFIALDLKRVRQLKNMLLGHLDQSFVTKTPLILTPLYRKPFMMALAAQALIQVLRHYRAGHGDSLPPADCGGLLLAESLDC
jgi:hypothetical protein